MPANIALLMAYAFWIGYYILLSEMLLDTRLDIDFEMKDIIHFDLKP